MDILENRGCVKFFFKLRKSSSETNGRLQQAFGDALSRVLKRLPSVLHLFIGQETRNKF